MSPPTPALIVDAETLDANLTAMQARCDAAGVALRPHVKGHKCAWIAARQLRAGARGLAAATPEEAVGLIAADDQAAPAAVDRRRAGAADLSVSSRRARATSATSSGRPAGRSRR